MFLNQLQLKIIKLLKMNVLALKIRLQLVIFQFAEALVGMV